MADKPLKILMTTDTVGGVWTYSLELCKALGSYNIRFFLVTMGRRLDPHQKKDVGALKNVEVIETDYLLEWMPDPWVEVDESGQWLLRLEKVLEPDLVHLNCFSYGSLPFQAPSLVVAHSDVYSWFLSVRNEDPASEWQKYFWRVKKGLEHTDLVIAPSQTMMQCLQQIYTERFKGRVIYNSRNFGKFRPHRKQPYVFSMGRIWDEAKNIQLLAQASEKIPFEIRVAGEQGFAGNQFEDAPFSRINYLGKLSETEVAAQLGRASIYVLPAKYEPFGLSVLEAALSGCVLVLGNIPSLKEIWGDSALYVDTDKPDALAMLVNNLMNSSEELEHYSQKALRRAMRYSTEMMAEKYMQAYRQLATRPHQQKEKAS
jgi:glycogen synthase